MSLTVYIGKALFSPQAQQAATGIAWESNNQFKPQVLNERRNSQNNRSTDAQLQQILQLGGALTSDTGAPLNNDFQNYDWNNYATAQRVQCAPSQAQNFHNALDAFKNSPGPNTFSNVITAMQDWNSAMPVKSG